MSSPEIKRESRRSFLKTTAQHGAVFVLGSGFCFGCTPETSSSPESTTPINLGKISSFALGFTALPVFRVGVQKSEAVDGFLFKAISLVCTHQTCLLDENSRGGFRCPCHGSEFDHSGQVLRGPAKKSLPYFNLDISEEGDLLLNRATPVSPDVSVKFPK